MTPTIKGPLHWSLGSFSAVGSSFLFASFPLVNGYMAIVISSGFTILTVCLYWAGIRAFKELPINYWIMAGFVLFQLFVATLFYSILPMPNVRMVAFSTISTLGCICKEFVEENNGSLVIHSNENVGTEVVVLLPSE